MTRQGPEPVLTGVKAKPLTWLVGLIYLVLSFWVLSAMAVVVIPVVFAVLITLLVAPLDEWVHRSLPRGFAWMAHLVVMLLIVAVVIMVFGALYFAGQQTLQAMPSITDELNELVPQSSAQTQDQTLPFAGEIGAIWGKAGSNFGDWVVQRATNFASSAVTMTGAFVTAFLIVFFLVLLMLIEMPRWRSKTGDLLSAENAQICHDTIRSISERLRKFLYVRTLIGVLQAALYTGWLALFGLDLLVVWAVLTFILTYIPNIGSIISGLLPVLYAFLVLDPLTAFWIGAGIFAIEQIVGNFIDPRFLGRQFMLSPVIILVALMFWGWLWGVAGAFLSTPLVLCLLVVSHSIEPLRPVALFLSNQSNMDHLDRALSN